MHPETGSIIPVTPTTLSFPFLFPFHIAVEGLSLAVLPVMWTK